MNLFVVILMIAISYGRAAKNIYVKTTGLTSPYFKFYESNDCTSDQYATLKLFVGTQYKFIRCDTTASHPMKMAKSLTVANPATPNDILGNDSAFGSETLTYTPDENDVGVIKYYCTVSEHTGTMNGDIDVVDLYGKAKQRTKKMWGDTYYNVHKNKFNDFENKVTEMGDKSPQDRATKAGRALNFEDFKLNEGRISARAKTDEAEKKAAKKDVALSRREIIKGALKQLKDAGKDEKFTIERTKGGFSKKFEDKMIAKGIQYVDVKKVKAKTGGVDANDCATKADVILSDLQADDAYEIVLEEESDFSFKCLRPGKPLSKLTLTKKDETDFNTYKAECWDDDSGWVVVNNQWHLHEDDSYTCDGYESYVASDGGTASALFIPANNQELQDKVTACLAEISDGSCPTLAQTLGHISTWDTGQVTNMGSMFQNAAAFNQDIGSWNTGQVTTMRRMFFGATAFNQPLTFDTSQVTDMANMFDRAVAFNQDISSWNTGRVTTMAYMFYEATAFNGDIGSWNTGQVTNMEEMFYEATAFDNGGQPLTFDTSKVETMAYMFSYATAFNQDISSWNTGRVTNMAYMFYEATAFNGDIGSWNTGQVTDMQSMFADAEAFDQDISSWDVSKVTSLAGTFSGAKMFDRSLSKWNVTSVTQLFRTFDESGLNEQNYPCSSSWTTVDQFFGGSSAYIRTSACSLCDQTGHYGAFDSTTCIACSSGQYQDDAYQDTCKNCPCGKWVVATGADSCIDISTVIAGGKTQSDVDAANATGYASGYAAGQAAGGGGQAGANCVDKNDPNALKTAYIQLGQC